MRKSEATFSPYISKDIGKSNHYTKVTSSKALTVRGGTGPLDPVVVAKVATAIVGVDVIVSVISPATTRKNRGLPTSPTLDFKCQFINYTAAAHILSAACILFRGLSINTAVAYGILVSTAPIVKSIVTGDAKKIGHPVVGLYIAAITNAVVAYSLLNFNVTTDLIKFFSLWGAVNGLGLMVMPLTMNSIWGVPTPSANDEGGIAFFNRFLGAATLAIATFYASLAFGVEAPKAVGYGLIPSYIVTLVSNFVTKDVGAYGLKKGPQFTAIALLTTFIIALVF